MRNYFIEANPPRNHFTTGREGNTPKNTFVYSLSDQKCSPFEVLHLLSSTVRRSDWSILLYRIANDGHRRSCLNPIVIQFQAFLLNRVSHMLARESYLNMIMQSLAERTSYECFNLANISAFPIRNGIWGILLCFVCHCTNKILPN